MKSNFIKASLVLLALVLTACQATVEEPESVVPPGQPGDVAENPKDGLLYVWVPPGEFEMGCSQDDEECVYDEEPSHHVQISKGFWLGQTEVTQAAFEKVMGTNPSTFAHDEFPVESVRWTDAVDYCEAVDGRLPTEAEWEYAARAGTQGARYGELIEIARFGGTSTSTTGRVGGKQPNAWGLHDMLGNVAEWTSDRYAVDYYQLSPSIDPPGPASGNQYVMRGGSWYDDAATVRVSSRSRGARNSKYYGVTGFRCAWD